MIRVGGATHTCGLSATCLAQCRMILMASILVSGNAALQANSDKHFTASWNESMVAEKCSSNIWAKLFTETHTITKAKLIGTSMMPYKQKIWQGIKFSLKFLNLNPPNTPAGKRDQKLRFCYWAWSHKFLWNSRDIWRTLWTTDTSKLLLATFKLLW